MSVRRNVYLDMKTLEEARHILFESFHLPDILTEETVAVPDAVNRVLSKPVTARVSSPSFHVAAMDGIAIKAEISFGVSETKPKVLTMNEDAFYVNTGHILPENTDAVIMVEVIQELDEDRVKIEAPAFPWQNVRRVGEDIVATELLFPQNHVVTPYCVGALLTGGVYSVSVKKRPEALIIPTGSELVDWRDLGPGALKPGEVIESNSFVLGKLIESWGGNFIRHKMIKDDVDMIRKCVESAIEDSFDFVLIAGGSSAGSED